MMDSFDWQRNVPYSLPLLLGAASTALLALYTWRRKEATGSKTGVLLMLACSEWILTYAFELEAVTPAAKIFWNKTIFLGVSAVPTLWFIFVVGFTGREHWLTRRNFVLLSIVPLTTLALVFTNDYHGLMWSEIIFSATFPIITLEKQFGPAYWCFIAYTYVLLLLSAYMLFQMLVRSNHLYRWQASALLLGEAVPAVGRAATILGLNPFAYLDIEVLGLVISSFMVAWSILRLRLLDIVPVARESIIEGMSDAVIVLDGRNHIVDMNPAAEALIGYSGGEAIGWRIDQIWTHWSEDLDISPEGSHIRKEVVLRNGGDSKAFDVSFSPLSDWRGRLMSRVIVLRDISMRKRSEEVLRENERRQAKILDAIPDMIYELDLTGKMLFANKFAREVIGVSENDPIDFNLTELLDDAGVKEAAKITKQLMNGEQNLPPSIYKIRRADGKTIPIEARGRLLHTVNGQKTILGVARDISERYQAEKLLCESEEKYRTLFEESRDVIYITTPEGNLIDINPAGVKSFGYQSKEELLKINVTRDLYANAADRARFQQAIARDGFVKDYEIVLKRKDNRRINMLVTANLVRDEQGKIISYRGMMRDITERKQLEQQLFQAQKLESIGTLAGGIAHDFNNILGGILGYASFMKTKIEQDHPFYNYIDTIEKSAVRASELTAKLLAFARGGKYDVKPIDINRIIDETLQIIGRTMDKSIEIELHRDASLPTVEGDGGQIQQILMNLCLNARDAMPAGGKLIIETRLSVLDSDYVNRHLGAKMGPHVTIYVTDTGIGMNEETKQRIFEPFFTTKEKGKGTGLGLSMVYAVAKNHGGFVSVYSEPGMGSTFKVYLPACGKPEVKTPASLGMPEGNNELILVVDDEAAICSLAKDALETYGYRVMTTQNGVEALDVYARHKDDISAVILDMVMPKMGGHEAFLRLKALNPNVKALLSTGYSQSGKAQEIMDSGVLGFIQKPYQLNELLFKLRSVLNN
jgi:PAS domain S-box-containing protein